MKRTKACAAAMAAVISLSVFAAAASAETVVTLPELASISEAQSSAELREGVYAVYTKGDSDALNKLSYYIVITDDTSGYTRELDLGIGLPFAYEQEKGKITFHFASADDISPAELKADDFGNLTGTIDHSGERTETVKLVPVTGVSPDTFEARVSAPIKKRKTNIFKRGVYTADDGVTKRYFVFRTDDSGIMINKGEEVGTAFTCVQNGSEIVFDFGGEGDETPATFKFADGKLYGTFQFDDGDFTQCMRFRKVKNGDPDKY